MNKGQGGGGGDWKGGLREGGLIKDLPVYGCVWWYISANFYSTSANASF